MASRLRAALAVCVFVSIWIPSVAGAQPEGANPCEIHPANSVDNGMGAEPGVVREFTSGLSIPAQCQIGGRSWVPMLGAELTRTAGGSTSLNFEVFLRKPSELEGPGLPGDFQTDPYPVFANGIPQFPGSLDVQFNSGAADNQNINNLLVGDTIWIGMSINGDTSESIFVIADQSGTPGETPCFTGLDGGVPNDACTNGNPLLNAAGQSACVFTHYGRHSNGAQSMGTEWAGSSFWGRHVARYSKEGPVSTDLRLREGPGGPVICAFFGIPDDFEYQCPLTPAQSTLLNAGGVVSEITQALEGGVVMTAPLVPANHHIFADSFESGDTSVW